MKSILKIGLLLFIVMWASVQTIEAAVTSPPTQNLILWLDGMNPYAPSATPNNGVDLASSWEDKSVSSNSPTTATDTGRRPTFFVTTNMGVTINGVYFEGGGSNTDHMSFANNALMPSSGSSADIFVVFESSQNSASNTEGSLLSIAHSQLDFGVKEVSGKNNNIMVGRNSSVDSYSYVKEGRVNMVQFRMEKQTNSPTSNTYKWSIYKNGREVSTGLKAVVDVSTHSSRSLGKTGSGPGYRGMIYEVLMYRDILNESDRIRVNQYLSNKWRVFLESNEFLRESW